jgi:hypothetical protein
MPRRTAIKSIRDFCVRVCCCGDMEYVRECPDGVSHQGVPPCPLWPFRMGHNPNISDEAREKSRQAAKSRNLGKKPSVRLG